MARANVFNEFHACPRYLQDSIKNEGDRVVNIFPIISLFGFFLTLKGSRPHSPCSDLAEFRTCSRCYECLYYLLQNLFEFGPPTAEIFMFESVNRRTDRLPSYKLICELLKKDAHVRCATAPSVSTFLPYCIGQSNNHKWFAFHE